MIHWPGHHTCKRVYVFILLTLAFSLSIAVNTACALETRAVRHLFDLTHAKDSKLSLPSDVATAPDGQIYVVDGNNHRVVVYDDDGDFEKIIGSQGSGEGQFSSPVGITVDKEGNVYVADSGNYRIQIFDSSGDFVRQIPLKERHEKIKPVDVAINHKKQILYITCNTNHKVMLYSVKGKFISAWGRKGNNPEEFRYPATITVSEQGLVYVVDVLNSRIQIFEPDGRLSTTAGTWGVLPGQLFRPKGVAVDSQEHIYVSDSYMDLIEVFDSRTRFSHVLGKNDTPHKFVTPAGISVDKRKRIYVAEMLENKVSVYQMKQD